MQTATINIPVPENKDFTVTVCLTDEIIKTSLATIIKELEKDKSEGSYYYTWQANIAQAFCIEYEKLNPHMQDSNKDILHRIANNAAKNFLDLLISERK